MLTVNKVGYSLPIKSIKNNKPAFKSNEGVLDAIKVLEKNTHSGTIGDLQIELKQGIKNTPDFAEKIRSLPDKMKAFLLKLSDPKQHLKFANDPSLSLKDRESNLTAYIKYKPVYNCLKEIFGKEEYQRLKEMLKKK